MPEETPILRRLAVPENEEKIQGGKVIFYGSEKEKPCGAEVIGTDDLGNQVIYDFEVYSCKDLGIRRSGRDPWTTMANLDPNEVLSVLIRGFRKCGCQTPNILLKE